MTREKRLPKSQRKFIRLQKAKIRAEFSDSKKQEELISNLYNKPVENTIKLEAKKKEDNPPLPVPPRRDGVGARKTKVKISK